MPRLDRTFTGEDLVRFFNGNLSEAEKVLARGVICGQEVPQDLITQLDGMLNEFFQTFIPGWRILVTAIANAALAVGNLAVPIVEASELVSRSVVSLQELNSEIELSTADF